MLLPIAILVVIILAVVVNRVRPDRPRKIAGWSAFFGWTFVGVLTAFSVAAALSVGALALPFLVILVGMMIWARPQAHSLLGLVAGVGALILFIGILNLGNTACEDEGVLIDGVVVFESGGEGSEQDGAETSCGGIPPAPWLAVGVTALAAGTALFAIAERRARDTGVEQSAA